MKNLACFNALIYYENHQCSLTVWWLHEVLAIQIDQQHLKSSKWNIVNMNDVQEMGGEGLAMCQVGRSYRYPTHQ